MDWRGLGTQEDLHERSISRTWYDVAQVLWLMLDEHTAGKLCLNGQETALLGELLESLSLYGYRPFTGLTFGTLFGPARLRSFGLASWVRGVLWNLCELRPAPSFQLGIPGVQLSEITGLDISGLQWPPMTSVNRTAPGRRRN
jgi:hypothetical protein